MEAHDAQKRVFVLTLPAVKWAIAELKSRKIHPFFPAYLHLRQVAGETGRDTGLVPGWEQLGELLAVQGGPPNKPFYRPMWNTNVNDPTVYWLNSNLAGSFAPRSLRPAALRVIETVDQEYSLRPRHVDLAREHLLSGAAVSAAAIAAFFYRDFGFTTPDDLPPGPSDLLEVLDRQFDLHDDDYDRILRAEVPATAGVDSWFVDIDDDPVGVT